MRSRTHLAAAWPLLILAGCALHAPPAQVPAPLPARWLADLPHDGAMGDLASWWARFDDLLLVQLVEAAQAASPTIATARTHIAQSRATRVASRAALFPAADGFASAQRGDNQPPLPLSTIVEAGMQASWEIDLFGGGRAGLRASQAREAQAQAGWHAARVVVAAETANAYVELRTCERQLAVVRDDAASRAETARLSGLSAHAGFTAPANLALAQASAADGAARARQVQAQCDADVKALVAMTAIAEPELRARLEAPWNDAVDVALAVDAVPGHVIAQRPDVFQAELEVAASSEEVLGTQAQRYPRVNITGSISSGFIRSSAEQINGQVWTIGPLQVTLPIFDAGRRAANVDAAQARYDEAVVQYRATVRQAVREVEEALVNAAAAQDRLGNTQAAVDGYRAAFAATDARWRGGLASVVELEDVRRTLLAAEITLVNVRRERIASVIALYRALGGGWTRDMAEASAAGQTRVTGNGRESQ